MKFELFFLGTSAGIPSIERNMPCIALRTEGKVYLFDVGECCQKQLMRYKVGYGSIRDIFITHLHMDHFLGVYGLIETLRMTTDVRFEKLNIFAPKGFENLLINRWEFLKVKKIRQGEIKTLKNAKIRAFKTKHNGKSYGFVVEEGERVKFNAEKAHKLGIKGRDFSRILEKGKLKIGEKTIKLEDISYKVKGKKIVYTGDTMYCDNTIKFAKNADILIHEATFLEEYGEDARLTKHSTVKDAALVAKKARVKKLVLTHISARYKKDEIEEFKRQAKKYYDGEVIVAEDGLRLKI